MSLALIIALIGVILIAVPFAWEVIKFFREQFKAAPAGVTIFLGVCFLISGAILFIINLVFS